MESRKIVWTGCQLIGKLIVKEFSTVFPEFKISTKEEQYNSNVQRQIVIVMEFNGVDTTDGLMVLTVQQRLNEDKPFVYMDSIGIPEAIRGNGLSRKILDCFCKMVQAGVFNHLNIKDWSDGYWGHVKKDFPFVRDKYTNGWLAG